jgi:peroxiredoxin
MMTSGKKILPRHFCICSALAITFLVTGLMVWLPSLPVSPAGAAQEDPDRYFQKLGIIKIPRIPPPEDFILADLDGRQVRLSDFKGKVVLLVFWTTWCPDCRIEMPALEKLHQRFKDRAFALVAVDLRESQTSVQKFFSNHNLSFTALLDSNGQVGHRFGIRSIPTAIILDQDGAMIGRAIGSRKWDGSAAAAFFEQLINILPNPQVTRAEESQ